MKLNKHQAVGLLVKRGNKTNFIRQQLHIFWDSTILQKDKNTLRNGPKSDWTRDLTIKPPGFGKNLQVLPVFAG
jgi:hypothetical protein